MSVSQEMAIKNILTDAVKRGASDLHFSVGNNPTLRIDDKLVALEDGQVITEEFMNDLIEQSPLEEVSNDLSKQLSKQEQTTVRLNQTGRLSKQSFKQLSKQPNSTQTSLEESLYSLTTMERTVVWSLLNTDLLLNYEDLSRILGKDKSTVRGQINNIKRKIPWLIEEKNESDGSKRFSINEEKKREILVNYVGKRLN